MFSKRSAWLTSALFETIKAKTFRQEEKNTHTFIGHLVLCCFYRFFLSDLANFNTKRKFIFRPLNFLYRCRCRPVSGMMFDVCARKNGKFAKQCRIRMRTGGKSINSWQNCSQWVHCVIQCCRNLRHTMKTWRNSRNDGKGVTIPLPSTLHDALEQIKSLNRIRWGGRSSHYVRSGRCNQLLRTE
jgi:hypothetical protein